VVGRPRVMIPIGIGCSVRTSEVGCRRRLLNLICMIKAIVASVGSMPLFVTNLAGGPIWVV